MTKFVSRIPVVSIAAFIVWGSLCSSSAFAQSPIPASIPQLIPVGKYQVDVMGRVFPKPLLAILQKLRAAAAAHPQEFQALSKRRDLHGPLPYDPVLGLTRAEYKQLNTLKPTSQQIGTAELEIGSKEGRRTLKASGSIAPLNGVTIDLKNGMVATSYGTLQKYSMVKAVAGQTITGPWDGLSWTFDPGGLAGRFPGQADPRGILQFNVGKLNSNGKTLVTLRFDSVDRRTLQDNVLIMIRFDVTHKLH